MRTAFTLPDLDGDYKRFLQRPRAATRVAACERHERCLRRCLLIVFDCPALKLTEIFVKDFPIFFVLLSSSTVASSHRSHEEGGTA
jgi:hypothetical protein